MTRKTVANGMTRRDLLKTASLATLGTAMCAQFVPAEEAVSSATSSNVHVIKGIVPQNVVDEYTSRELDAVSDANLYRQSAAIVSTPPDKRATSFTLHAPLELMARYGLLPLVDPKERSLARLQMVAMAAAYDAGGTAAPASEKMQSFPDIAVAKAEFTEAFRSRHGRGLESVVLRIAAQFGTASLVHLLTPLALPTLTGASHSHIGLWLLLRHGTASDPGDAGLLRAAARSLAARPDLQLKSFDGMSIAGGKPLTMSPAEIEADILDKLTGPPRTWIKSSGMRQVLEAGEKTGNADSLFGDFIRHDLTKEQMDAAFRAVLRVCAHSMLQDARNHAKYGWSHCLTLPQAACGLSSLNMHRKLGLATTLVWIVAYRSVMSNQSLDFNWTPEKLDETPSLDEALHTSPEVAAARFWHAEAGELPEIRRTLATQASIRNDQHLVKYTRACFDMVSFDPTHAQLYLSAAAYLCSLWMKERPRNMIYDNLLVRRST